MKQPLIHAAEIAKLRGFADRLDGHGEGVSADHLRRKAAYYERKLQTQQEAAPCG